MDFATLMAQIHSSGLDETSVEDIVAMSTPAADNEFPLDDSIPGMDMEALKDFLVDYLDMMAVGGVGGASFNLVEIDNLASFQLIELAKQYGVDLDQFKTED